MRTRRRTFWVTIVAAGLVVASASTGWAQHRYHDIGPNDTHYEGIEMLSEAGIVGGFDDGYFRATDGVTRGQLATMIATAAHLETTGEPPFEDVSADHTHARGITALAELELVRGYPDGSYRPDRLVSRGQVAVLAEAYRLDGGGDPPFSDVTADHPHAPGIAAITGHGHASGFEDGTYRAELPVTRGQIATLLASLDPQLSASEVR